EGIFKAMDEGVLRDVEIACVISNKRDAYILERARQRGVEAIFIDPKGKDRETYDKEVAAELDKCGVDLVLLIGYMRILSSWFVNKYRWKIMNIHPSLLPAFAGGMDLDVHRAVLDYGVKVTGCTLHFVDEGVDTGPIILQKAVPVDENDTPETLKPKVQRAEQEIIVEAIRLFQEGRLKIEGKRVRILPPSTIQHELKVGMNICEEYQTDRSHAAKNIDSGDVQVLSTPSMISFMEITSNKLAQQGIPQGYITVGTGISVKHLNPAPIGEKIKVTSEIIEIDGRRIKFKVNAMWRNVLLGEGEHERHIVNVEKFLGKLRDKLNK
ncbi:MAG: phosphoribosylglycinamide formyltransferase, partial [Candidatus Methanomethylicia archaeon]